MITIIDLARNKGVFTESSSHLEELRLRDGAIGLLTPGHHLLWEKVLEGKTETR